eukprot:GHVS01089975.1.p1 GENE.GHVS01089975.1~~GHVS01089975.1.p1  ORF type:complete len:114 (+),score=11.14 GHVS01089975.1:416-757(+)
MTQHLTFTQPPTNSPSLFSFTTAHQQMVAFTSQNYNRLYIDRMRDTEVIYILVCSCLVVCSSPSQTTSDLLLILTKMAMAKYLRKNLIQLLAVRRRKRHYYNYYYTTLYLLIS